MLMMVVIRDGWPRGSDPFPSRRLVSRARLPGAHGSPHTHRWAVFDSYQLFLSWCLGEVVQGGSSAEDSLGQTGVVVEGEKDERWWDPRKDGTS